MVYGHPAHRSPRFDDEPEARKRTPSRVRSGSRSRCLPAAVAALAACVACSVIRSADRAPQSKEPSEQVVFRVGCHGQDCWQGGVASRHTLDARLRGVGEENSLFITRLSVPRVERQPWADGAIPSRSGEHGQSCAGCGRRIRMSEQMRTSGTRAPVRAGRYTARKTGWM